MRAAFHIFIGCFAIFGKVCASNSNTISRTTISLVQFEKASVLKQSSNSSGQNARECAGLGRSCVPNWSKTLSHSHQDTDTPGPDTCCDDMCVNSICEDPDYTLFKCSWTQKGIDWICRSGTLAFDNASSLLPVLNLVGWSCPRIWDPVSDIDWTIAVAVSAVDGIGTIGTKIVKAFVDGVTPNDVATVANSLGPLGLGVTELGKRALGGYNMWGWQIQESGNKLPFTDYFQCGAYALECTWTQMGVDMYADECDNTTGREGYWDWPVPGPREFGYCDESVKPKEAGDKATYMQLGVKDDKWYLLAEYGFLNCLTPQSAFVAKTQGPVKAQAIQCGNLPFNCKSKREAEDACKLWSADDQIAGKYSGKAELCYKWELGKTVGPSCRPMWTKDSKGTEGCYESNNNWWEVQKVMNISNSPNTLQFGTNVVKLDKPLLKKYLDTTMCEGNVGDVVCYQANEPELVETMDVGRQQGEELYGFDAACCIGHYANPYRDRVGPLDWVTSNKD